jgi:murein DD-endopeptidase MepM/ murein hydrolase activator NlpD
MRKDPFTHKQSMHNGIDMAALPGTKIHAPAAGMVARVFNNGGYGKFIEIEHSCGVTTRYGHLQKALVKTGQKVHFNQPIATIGNSGRSTGPHLHYEILLNQQPQNPASFLKAGKYVFKNTQTY